MFMGPTWSPPGSCRPQMGPMLAPWTLVSGQYWTDSCHLQFDGTVLPCRRCGTAWSLASWALAGSKRNSCWCCNSTTVRLIRAISSSMALACRCATAWSLASWALAGIPVGHSNSCGGCNTTTAVLDWFMPCHVLLNHPGLSMCNGMVIFPSCPSGHSHRAPKFLQVLKLLNCWTDLLHLKFYEAVLAHRCAMVLTFARWVPKFLGTL